jgi:uncharacterized glyoxalase superfamily protein PhnB
MASTPHNAIAVGFTVTDMQKSIKYYRDQLGFTLSECWPDEKTAMWCNMMLGNQSVMFGAAMKPEQATEMCGGDSAAGKFWKSKAEEYQKSAHGVGVNVYIHVDDVDKYYAQVTKKGAKANLEPKSQFYGLRDFVVSDPDGYTLTFYQNIVMSSCQSCGMPLTDAAPGQMYCQYCTDEKGKLRPYESVFEGTVTGYFMQMQKMPRKDAETAAREHLKKMPAWAAHH